MSLDVHLNVYLNVHLNVPYSSGLGSNQENTF